MIQCDGEEAYVQPSTTRKHGVFLLEEKRFGPCGVKALCATNGSVSTPIRTAQPQPQWHLGRLASLAPGAAVQPRPDTGARPPPATAEELYGDGLHMLPPPGIRQSPAATRNLDNIDLTLKKPSARHLLVQVYATASRITSTQHPGRRRTTAVDRIYPGDAIFTHRRFRTPALRRRRPDPVRRLRRARLDRGGICAHPGCAVWASVSCRLGDRGAAKSSSPRCATEPGSRHEAQPPLHIQSAPELHHAAQRPREPSST